MRVNRGWIFEFCWFWQQEDVGNRDFSLIYLALWFLNRGENEKDDDDNKKQKVEKNLQNMGTCGTYKEDEEESLL